VVKAYTIESLADLLQVAVCSIWLLDADTGDLVIKQSVGREPRGDPQHQDRLLTKGLIAETFIGKVLMEKNPKSLLNVREASDFYYTEDIIRNKKPEEFIPERHNVTWLCSSAVHRPFP
jgi:hypothetical protein